MAHPDGYDFNLERLQQVKLRLQPGLTPSLHVCNYIILAHSSGLIGQPDNLTRQLHTLIVNCVCRSLTLAVAVDTPPQPKKEGDS